MKTKIYKQPLYYDIAFSFIDAKKQVKLFEKFIKKYSKVKVKTVLDIGCGPALQLREFAKKGYKTIGLDISLAMIQYLHRKALAENLKIEIIKANMINFQLKNQVDLAFIMMGSIIYFKNNNEFLNHLDSVAVSLRCGGLYLIENFPMTWDRKEFYQPQTWEIKKNGIKIKTTYQILPKDALNQMITQTIKFDVNDHDNRFSFADVDNLKLIFPQEFITLIKLNNKFEFLGWFKRNEMRLIKKAQANNLILLRKR